MAVSVLAAGMVISASSGAQDRPTAKTIKSADQRNGTLKAIQPWVGAAQVVETIKISGDQAGNKRYPGVAENAAGDRLVIFMGHDSAYWYSFCRKGGSWSTPAGIPGQPALDKFLGADVEVDSTGRFHCVWEEPGSVAVYGSFFNGVWTTPFALQNVGGYDMSPSIAVRSNDEVLIGTSQIISAGYLTKDVFLYVKGKTESQFRGPKNLTNDRESSCQAWIAVDANNHLWEVHKSDSPNNPNPAEDLLVIFLTHWDANNNAVGDWQLVSTNQGWSFWPQVAANSAGKVMTAWPHAQSGDYWSRLYDPATQTLSSPVPLNVGLSTNPWCTFWSKLAAHGEDFYIAAINPARILFLLKYDEQTSQWNRVAQISDTSVQNFDLYSGADKMLVAWGENDDPANVYLTTVEVSSVTTEKQTLTIQTSSGGTTSPSPGSYRYPKGSSVSIRAIPDAGYQLSSWSGDASGNATTVTVTLDRDMTIQANFAGQTTLIIQAGPGGTTDPSPGTYRYGKGSRISIKAIADAAHRFGAWSGDAFGDANPVTITLDRDMTVKANFPLQSTLIIQTGPGGTTDPSPGTYRYDTGSSISVRAIAEAGYRLSAWWGDAFGDANPVAITLDRDMTVKANFILIPIPKPPLDLALETGLDASQTNKINTLTWHGNPENAGIELKEYWIYRKRANLSDGDFAKIASVSSETFQYMDRGLPLNQKFAYGLTTIPLDSYAKESERSEFVTEISTFPPLAVACKTVVNNSLFRKEKINVISWQANPLNETVTIAQYNIYRKKADQDDSAYKLIASLAGSAVEYQDRNLSFSEKCIYVIRALDSGGNSSGMSNPAGE